MIANVSDCGELHNKLYKLSDMNELFARVPLPYNVLIDVPKLDNALPATHSGVESKFVMPVHDWKVAHLQVVRRVVLNVLRRSRRSVFAEQNILYPSILKGAQIETNH